MKTISLKLSDQVLNDMDEHMQEAGFSTRTEFIREAIRDKLHALEEARFEQEMRSFFRNNKAEFVQKKWLHGHNKVFDELERRFG